MAITSAIMQMRRGMEADFDPDMMHPGEWAVSTDTKYVRMCFSPGVCVRMATYDAFETDMAQIQAILSEVETIEEAVIRINDEVSANADAVVEYTALAKQYRDEAKQFRDEAESIAGVGIATTETAGIVKPDGTTIRVDEDGTIHADNGTVDYNELENKPQINGVELSGEKSLSELGIASADDLEETNKKLDTIIEKAELNIKNTATGENIHLTDSADSKAVSFGLYGKAEQKQYSGKNLFNPNLVEGENYTEALMYYEIEKLPTSGGGYYASFNPAIPLVTGKYTNYNPLYYIPCTPSTNYTIQAPIEVINAVSSGSEIPRQYEAHQTYARMSSSGITTFTTGSSDTYLVLLGVLNADITPYLDSIQIEVGSEATPYEPYVGGASPNPEYPQDIEVAGADGSVEVKSVGENLASEEYLSLYANNDTKKFDTSAVQIRSSLIKVKPNTAYLLGRKGGAIYSTLGFSEKEPVVGEDCIVRYIGSSEMLSVTTPNNANYMLWYHSSGSTTIATEIFCYETTEVSAEYKPYKSTTANISTPNGLASIGDVCDEIIKYADGSGKRIQRIGQAVFDGSNDEGWAYSATYSSFDITVSDRALTQNSICSHYVNEKSWSNFMNCSHAFFAHTNGRTLRFKDIDVNNVNEWRSKLTSNPITVYYELAEPIETPLTAEDIAEIEKLHTFYPVTNISNDADCGMSITYKADAQNYIDNRLALIESAMLNNI